MASDVIDPPDWCDHCGGALYLFVHEPLIEYIETQDRGKPKGSQLVLVHEECLLTSRVQGSLGPPSTCVATVQGHLFEEWQAQLREHGFSARRVEWMTKRVQRLIDYDEQHSKA